MKKFFKSFFLTLLAFLFACPAGLITYAQESTKVDLESTPIDVVYKYIDLCDLTLHRDGIPNNPKDYDNNELMYSMRSVLKNIPWVRKIFIIMPNDKVRFLKEPDEIKDRIVYIKDKDILGMDSSSSICFEFSLWKLKDFGCSENFIYMNDDCFIGKPMKKSDFFYIENNKVVPYVIRKDSGKLSQHNNLQRKWIKMRKETASYIVKNDAPFTIQCLNSLMFLYKIFKRDIFVSMNYAHNALGENLTELKELYDLVSNNYKYANDCLHAKTRNLNALQHQITYNFYLINKYNRKINRNISYAYIPEHNVTRAKFNTDLYCINFPECKTHSYTKWEHIKSKVKMAQLFPTPHQYEKENYNDWVGIDPQLKKRAESLMRNPPAPAKPKAPTPRRTQNQKTAPTPRPHRNPGRRR